MRPVKKGRGGKLRWFQTPAWMCRWLMLFCTETEMKRGGLGRGGVVRARSRELNLKCLREVYLGFSSRWLLTAWD